MTAQTSTTPCMGTENIGMFFAKLAEQVTNNQVTVVIISPSVSDATPKALSDDDNSSAFFCCITEEAIRIGKAEKVENELRMAAKTSARKLIGALRTNEALNYVHTNHLSSQELFDMVNAHYGLKYGVRNFTKYRDEK